MSQITAFLAASFLLLAGSAAVAAPSLRQGAVVEGSVIHLGDLFTDAGARAGDIVAPTPPAGSRTIFDATWLAATARDHGLIWQPASSFDQAVIERATAVISADAIAAHLLRAIGQRQPVEGDEIQLDNAALHLLVPAEASDRITVEGLSFEPRSGRFSAYIAVPADTADTGRQRVTGRLIRMIELPVLARPVGPGEVIALRDLLTVKMRSERVGSDTVIDAHELVGKSPRHALRAQEPVRIADVQIPVVVHKGDLVTIVLQTSTMRLTAQGKALDDGGMNAAIRISNTKSARVIDAVVTGPNAVTVSPTAQFAAR